MKVQKLLGTGRECFTVIFKSCFTTMLHMVHLPTFSCRTAEMFFHIH